MKVRKRPLEVDAVQWSPGVAVEGLRVFIPEIVRSLKGDHFYLSARDPKGAMATAWLPDADGGDVLPFAFWSVKSGERYPAVADEPRTKRALHYMRLAEIPPAYAVLDDAVGSKIVALGSWIVTFAGGRRSVFTPEEFAAEFEEAPQSAAENPS